jgi:signal peptidase II
MQLFKKKKPIEYTIYWAVMTSVIALDMITKFLTYALLPEHSTVPIIKGILHFTHINNRGAAFGMLADHRWVFITVSTAVIIGILCFLFLGHADSRLMGVALAMIGAGGLSNMIDRVALGYVVDFIEFAFIDFAVFNVADSCVCIGAGLLVLCLIIEFKNEVNRNKEKNGN